ncbi:MAG: M48 family metalloprotease [Ignavibacteriales bacterium]|nr:M48 family metalloprotease [Ignavibacteriales bacterium]
MRIAPVVIVVLAFALAACEDGFNIYDKAEEVELGDEEARQIEREVPGFRLFEEKPGVERYLERRIFEEVLSTGAVANRDVFDYRLHLVDNPNEEMAFALPGGRVYLYTGLLLAVRSEAELAGVIAHEVGHIELRHGAERMTMEKTLGVALAIASAFLNNPVADFAGSSLAQIGVLSYSREDEREADDFSVAALKDTRYYPGGAKLFFERLIAQKKADPDGDGYLVYLSTHPDVPERIDRIEERLRELGRENVRLGEEAPGLYGAEYRANVWSPLARHYNVVDEHGYQ